MTDEEKRGRRILLSYSALILLTSASIIFLYVSQRGQERLPAQVVRFLLTVGLCWWLYQGSILAKWIMVVLMSAGGVLALMALFANSILVVAFSGGMAVLYLTFVVVLLTSPNVAAFLAYQRNRDRTSY